MSYRSRLIAAANRLRGSNLATIDAAATPPPSPLAPTALLDEEALTEVLELGAQIGDVLLASGMAAMDTTTQITAVLNAYGLHSVHVEVTFNSIMISATREAGQPSLTAVRVVRYRTLDFSRLGQIDRLFRQIRSGTLPAAHAQEIVKQIVASPHAYPRWMATVAWGGLAASIAVLIGADFLVASTAFLTTVVIDRVSRRLNHLGLPSFFQQLVGGFIATIPAGLFFTWAESSSYDASIVPSQIIAAGITVLLSGLSLVGSIQDAITGAPITASARFFELVMMTGGIIAGIAIAIRFLGAINITLPPATALASTTLPQLPVMTASGAVASACFALACYSERRAIWVSGLVGGVGMMFYGVAQLVGLEAVLSAGFAASTIGLLGGLLARRALLPPFVIGVTAITPFLPGLSVYRGLYSFLNDQTLVGFRNIATALGIAAALGAGVIFGEWVARTIRRPQMLSRAGATTRPTVIMKPIPEPAPETTGKRKKFRNGKRAAGNNKAQVTSSVSAKPGP